MGKVVFDLEQLNINIWAFFSFSFNKNKNIPPPLNVGVWNVFK